MAIDNVAGEMAPIPPGALLRHPPIRQLVLIAFLMSASYSITLASLPLWEVSKGRSASLAGLPTTVMLLATIITQPFVPWLMGRFGTYAMQVVGLALLGATWPMTFIGPDLKLVAVVAAARGVGFGILTVVGGSLLATLTPLKRFGECVSLMGLAIATANLICAPAGVALVKAGHFLFVAILGAITIAGIPVAMRLRHAHGHAIQKEGRSQRRSSIFRTVPPALIMLVVTLAVGGVSTYLPISDRSGQLATIGVLLLGTGATLTSWRAGRIVDRRGLRIILPAGISCAVSGVVAIGVGLLLHGDAKGITVLVGAFILGLGYGAVQTATNVASFARVPTSSAMTASATWNFSYDTGTGMGVAIVGALGTSALGFSGAFAMTGVLMALTFPIAVRVGSRHASSRGHSRKARSVIDCCA